MLVQRATGNEYNVIVAPAGPFTDVDVSMRFRPMSGRIDASGGIVFRFDGGRYYVIRANALEDNFRLYYYDRGRHQIASARVPPPVLGQWHTVRVVAVGDRIQGYLDGKLLIDHRDTRFGSGRVGLWTKADSVTAFDDLRIRGVRRVAASRSEGARQPPPKPPPARVAPPWQCEASRQFELRAGREAAVRGAAAGEPSPRFRDQAKPASAARGEARIDRAVAPIPRSALERT